MAKASFSDDVMRVIKAAAPTVGGIIGTAIMPGVGTGLGTAAASMAVEALGKALGTDPTPEAINTRIEADLAVIDTGGQGALLRETDLHAKLNRAEDVALAKINADLEIAKQRLDNEDRSGARQMQQETRVWTPAVVTYILLLSTIAFYAAGFFIDPPAPNREYIAGGAKVLETLTTAAVFFWVGSSIGSKRNADAIRSEMASRR